MTALKTMGRLLEAWLMLTILVKYENLYVSMVVNAG